MSHRPTDYLRPLFGHQLSRLIVNLTLIGAASRIVSFLYYIGAARLLAPAGFGVVRYTITLGLAVFGPIQVLTHAVSREVGAARGSARAQQAVIGTAVALAPIALSFLVLACAIADWLDLLRGATFAGLVVVVVGLTIYQLYSGIARGIGDYRRAAMNDFLGAVVQLAGLGVLAAAGSDTTLALLLVFGLSSVVPMVGYELVAPILWRRRLRVTRTALRGLVRIAAPLLVAEICFYVWLTADQAWVANNLGSNAVGLYGSAKTMAMLMVILPNAVTAVLLPHVAELTSSGRSAAAARLIRAATFATLGISIVVAGIAALLSRGLLTLLFGAAFAGAAHALSLLFIGMAVYAGFAVLALCMVGAGRPLVNLAGVAVAAIVQIVYLVFLTDGTLTSVAISSCVAIVTGFVMMLLLSIGWSERAAQVPPASPDPPGELSA